MNPPFFVWKAGTLDVCDTLDELEERYPRTTLANMDVVVCDSQGSAVWISRARDGAWTNAIEEPQPPSLDLLRNILRDYLEKGGMTAEEVDSLSSAGLVAKVCPPDPLPDKKVKEAILWKVAILAFSLLCIAVAMLFDWLRGVH